MQDSLTHLRGGDFFENGVWLIEGLTVYVHNKHAFRAKQTTSERTLAICSLSSCRPVVRLLRISTRGSGRDALFGLPLLPWDTSLASSVCPVVVGGRADDSRTANTTTAAKEKGHCDHFEGEVRQEYCWVL